MNYQDCESDNFPTKTRVLLIPTIPCVSARHNKSEIQRPFGCGPLLKTTASRRRTPNTGCQADYERALKRRLQRTARKTTNATANSYPKPAPYSCLSYDAPGTYDNKDIKVLETISLRATLLFSGRSPPQIRAFRTSRERSRVSRASIRGPRLNEN